MTADIGRPPWRRVLVANRGEIAVRIIATLHRLGIEAVAVHSEADAGAPHVRLADASVLLGPAPADQSYLRAAAVIDAARSTGAEAIHPGYGFLSERADFAAAVEAAGFTFLGPTPDQIRLFGDKHTARQAAQAAGVPLLAGSGVLTDETEARTAADAVGYPVMLKSVGGGGGIGMAVCRDEGELREALPAVRRVAGASFGAAGVYLERFVDRARHVEVQIFGDGHGEVVALGDRDCSAQRRNQKILEEAPAPELSDVQRAAMTDAAVALARSVGYRSAGTVEFLVDADRGEHAFLEVNTRLQVEHPVTEATCGIDLVEWMVRVGAGDLEPLRSYRHDPRGHAIEARIYAEDPARDFRPSAGLLTEVRWPEGVRCDTWIEPGTEVTPFYDPLLAKLVVHATTRDGAVAALANALEATRVAGIETNLGFLADLVAADATVGGRIRTATVAAIEHRPATIEVLDAGNLTTVQDWPGRLGRWPVGVPPSGPMDPLAFRLANRIVGNDEHAAGLELTVRGPTVRFDTPTTFCVAGAHMDATLDDRPVPWWRPVEASTGAVLALGTVTGPGCRSYLAVRGGIDVPSYLGSRATFTLGGFGGHGGRALRAGDVLHRGDEHDAPHPAQIPESGVQPEHSHRWQIRVLPGPHAAPDYFTDDDIDTFYRAEWSVHHNSARTGVRLVGPRPTWARTDGGDAGLHPSNIHDTPYAVGTVDFTGDMPIILGPDGPSLGGFVCPATTISADLWKVGQLSAGDTVTFVAVDGDEAQRACADQDRAIGALSHAAPPTPPRGVPAGAPAVLGRIEATQRTPAVTYRRAGDRAVLVEYGPDTLDLDLRLRVHALMVRLGDEAVPGIIELTPGIRSLQVHLDSRVTTPARVLEVLAAVEGDLPPAAEMVVRSRVVHLPLSWDDPSTIEATQRYMATVRDDAPWCPHNLEFIRRVNGLASLDEVRSVVFDARYLVLGLGDVYLGAPVATPLDPRHRLITTKYNPARTWTPENAVGIGGAYLCVYGMEGPGGYQFVGRTTPVWNTWRTTPNFEPERPWLLRFFDQISFYPVSADELMDLRRDLRTGQAVLDITETTFSAAEHRRFLEREAVAIDSFRQRQRAAFEVERAQWVASGELDRTDDPGLPESTGPGDGHVEVPDGGRVVTAPLGASVWRVDVAPGQVVADGEPLVVLEAMKMETVLTSSTAGEVVEVRCRPGQVVAAGEPLVVLGPV